MRPGHRERIPSARANDFRVGENPGGRGREVARIMGLPIGTTDAWIVEPGPQPRTRRPAPSALDGVLRTVFPRRPAGTGEVANAVILGVGTSVTFWRRAAEGGATRQEPGPGS